MKQENTVSAVIFDMDGLMLDTERIARRAWRRALKEFGYHLTDDLYITLVGRNARDGRRLLRAAMGDDFPLEACEFRAREIYGRLIDADDIPVKTGLMELLDFLETRSIKTAVATSTSRKWAIPKLTGTELISRFATVVTGDDVLNGKPHPDIFLAASHDIGVKPEQCIVLEDSLNGIRAAKAAGMIPIMVPDLIQPTDEIRSMAHSVAATLCEAKTVIAQLLDGKAAG